MADELLIALFVASLTTTPRAPARPNIPGNVQMRHGLTDTINRMDEQMDMYERPDLLDAALDCIPLDQIQATAEKSLEAQEIPGLEDGLADALVKWFKNDFFKWVDPIKCQNCGGKTSMREMVTPNAEERAGGAGRVELHVCDSEKHPCSGNFRFARYNDPKVLMKTRLGRCGEFANVFCLFVRAIGLRARYVWNAEDHVWTEYFSPALGRWIHLDSCEGARDEPLLYDRGWGKKMSYIFAFGVDGAQDVSRGYVQDWSEALKRRRQGPEDALRLVFNDVRRRRRLGLPSSDLERLAQEDAVEEQWLRNAEMRGKVPTNIDEQGRESGTDDWKRERGEDGA